MQLTTMTELDAVNLMLSVIGEAPVNSLNSTGLSDVAMAQNILKEVALEIQDDGWSWNQEDDIYLPLTVEGFVYKPTNALRIECMESEDRIFTIRGDRLYDRVAHSYIFTTPVCVQVTYFLDYVELPQAARFYIAIRAARKFQKRSTSSTILEKFSEMDEFDALANCQDQDISAGDYNMLTGNPEIAKIWIR